MADEQTPEDKTFKVYREPNPPPPPWPTEEEGQQMIRRRKQSQQKDAKPVAATSAPPPKPPPPPVPPHHSTTKESAIRVFDDDHFQQFPWKSFFVDVRENYRGDAIQNSLHLPFHSVYYDRLELWQICRSGYAEQVIFYGDSSEDGRAKRIAGAFHDFCKAKARHSFQVFALEGGIEGWVKGGKRYTDCMKNYDAAYWSERFRRRFNTSSSGCTIM